MCSCVTLRAHVAMRPNSGRVVKSVLRVANLPSKPAVHGVHGALHRVTAEAIIRVDAGLTSYA